MKSQMNQHPYDYPPSEQLIQHFDTMKKVQIEQIQTEERLPFQEKQELKEEEEKEDENDKDEQKEAEEGTERGAGANTGARAGEGEGAIKKRVTERPATKVGERKRGAAGDCALTTGFEDRNR